MVGQWSTTFICASLGLTACVVAENGRSRAPLRMRRKSAVNSRKPCGLWRGDITCAPCKVALVHRSLEGGMVLYENRWFCWKLQYCWFGGPWCHVPVHFVQLANGWGPAHIRCTTSMHAAGQYRQAMGIAMYRSLNHARVVRKEIEVWPRKWDGLCSLSQSIEVVA